MSLRSPIEDENGGYPSTRNPNFRRRSGRTRRSDNGQGIESLKNISFIRALRVLRVDIHFSFLLVAALPPWDPHGDTCLSCLWLRHARFCAVHLLLNAHLRYELPDNQRKESQMRKKLTVQGLIIGLVFMGQSITYAADAKQGKEMYVQYCSSCHGEDGRGSGAVSAFLKVKVPDLLISL
jgi:hypothetical protein